MRVKEKNNFKKITLINNCPGKSATIYYRNATITFGIGYNTLIDPLFRRTKSLSHGMSFT
jgi:hypothetical protein